MYGEFTLKQQNIGSKNISIKRKSAQNECEQPAKITVAKVGARSKISYTFSHTIHQKNTTK